MNYFARDEKKGYTKKQKEVIQEILHHIQKRLDIYKKSQSNDQKSIALIMLSREIEAKYKLEYKPPYEDD